MKTYVEIGANIGNDDFQRLIETLDEKVRVLLVEPNTELLNTLDSSYSKLKDKHEIIIHPYGIALNNSVTSMHVFPDSGHSSLMNRRHHIPAGGKIREVQTMTFNDMCAKFSITEIEYLSIDAEGLDYEILNSIDLSQVDINTIVFEKWNIENDDLDGIYRTGLSFLNAFIVPKYKDYVWEDIILANCPTYKLTKKGSGYGL